MEKNTERALFTTGGGCLGAAALAGALTCTGICAGVADKAWEAFKGDNTQEMVVADRVRYADGGLKCRQEPKAGAPIVKAYQAGETVEVDLDRPAQGDWVFTTDGCWTATQLAGVPYLSSKN